MQRFLEYRLQWFMVTLDNHWTAVDVLMKLDAGKHDSQELFLYLSIH